MRIALTGARLARQATMLAALLAAFSLPGCAQVAASAPQPAASPPQPLAIGETFTIASRILGETRRINVYRSPMAAPTDSLPVLYMPDGGIAEDFLHVAGLVQVLSGNGSMRPFLLVGIENTARRRDLTGPTTRDEDRRIAPVVGGSAAFRRFIRDELMPAIAGRYRVTDERAIVGESLAGLFVLETLLAEPSLFDTWIAFDPSLWWNGGKLLDEAAARLGSMGDRRVYVAHSGEPSIIPLAQRFADALKAHAPPAARWEVVPMSAETHATIYHPAALRAFRSLFAPAARQAR